MASFNYLICIFFFWILASSQAQDIRCPVEDGNIPHSNCTLYITCQNGVPTVFECPNDLYYNPLMGYCDYPTNVLECVDGIRSSVATEPTIVDETTQTDPVETTTEGPSNGCPAEGFKLIPHPERCEKFFYCLNGDIIDDGECAPGLYFDPELEQCNLEELVDCRNPGQTTTTTTTTTTRPPPPTCPPTGIVNLPYPGNCSLYILCVNGVPVLSQCASGTLFDPISLRCRPAEDVDCDAVSRETLLVESEIMQEDNKESFYCPGGEEFRKMPVINDCHSWYECRKGRKSKSASKKCPHELFFSFEKQSCVLYKPNHC